VRSDPSSSTTALTLNPGRAPLTDRDLRRAIAGAIDKPGVIRAVGHPEVLAFGLLPPGFDAYRATAAATQPVPAKLGAYAGLPPISALIDSSSSNSVILEKIQADVLARLGLRLEIQAQEWKGFIGRVLRDPPPLFRMSWPAWYRDPYSFLENYTTGHPANILKWSNARYDRVLAQLAEAAPGPRRRRLAEQAQQILVDDEAVLVPLFHVRYQHAISRALQGFNLTSLGVIDFSRLNWLPKK
jgi:ABC-type oligopeptide transport system substrate-binding subunit